MQKRLAILAMYLTAAAVCAVGLVYTGDFTQFDYWIERYQTLIAGAGIALVAWTALKPAWDQNELTPAPDQDELVAWQNAYNFRGLLLERLKRVAALRPVSEKLIAEGGELSKHALLYRTNELPNLDVWPAIGAADIKYGLLADRYLTTIDALLSKVNSAIESDYISADFTARAASLWDERALPRLKPARERLFLRESQYGQTRKVDQAERVEGLRDVIGKFTSDVEQTGQDFATAGRKLAELLDEVSATINFQISEAEQITG
jgi:hypothetical protein